MKQLKRHFSIIIKENFSLHIILAHHFGETKLMKQKTTKITQSSKTTIMKHAATFKRLKDTSGKITGMFLRLNVQGQFVMKSYFSQKGTRRQITFLQDEEVDSE